MSNYYDTTRMALLENGAELEVDEQHRVMASVSGDPGPRDQQ